MLDKDVIHELVRSESRIRTWRDLVDMLKNRGFACITVSRDTANGFAKAS